MQKVGKTALLFSGLVMLAMLLLGCCCASLPNFIPTNNATNAAVTGCSTKDCFIAAANDCNETSLAFQEDYGLVNYSAENCTFTKTIVRLNDNETQDMKNLLEGSSLTCTYGRGQFDENWTSSLIIDIDNCTGDLRDKLADLSVFAPDNSTNP
jgi:hypothetical protein